jgi:hypothetical protein
MPSKKSGRAKKSPQRFKMFSRLTEFTGMTKLARLSREHATVAIPLAVIAVLAAWLVIAAQPISPRTEMASNNPQTETALAQAPAEMPAAPSAPTTSVADSTLPGVTPVTITGCLERSNEMFRLKETAGEDAPKARSWKSAFLKKGPASVQVVDASNRVKLQDHVGQRVSVTGTLIDREMQVHSLHRVASSCSSNARVKI